MDTRRHTARIKATLKDVIDHAREDVSKATDPKAQALFETTAEVAERHAQTTGGPGRRWVARSRHGLCHAGTANAITERSVTGGCRRRSNRVYC